MKCLRRHRIKKVGEGAIAQALLQADRYCEIGLIVGMQYIAEGNQPTQWYYRIQYLKCDYAPCVAGTYDEYFKEESRFVADNTAI